MSIEIANRLANPDIASHERPTAAKYRTYSAVNDRPIRLLVACSRYSLPLSVVRLFETDSGVILGRIWRIC